MIDRSPVCLSLRWCAAAAFLAIPLACGGGGSSSGTGGSGGNGTGGTGGAHSTGGSAGTHAGGMAGGGSGGALGGAAGSRTGVGGSAGAVGGAGGGRTGVAGDRGSAGGAGGDAPGGAGGQGGAAAGLGGSGAGGSGGLSGTAGTGTAGNGGAAGSVGVVVIHTTNLIVNGDAEDAAGATDAAQPVDVPGWTITGHGTAFQYGLSGYPGPTDPGPTNRGANLFIGGTNDALSTFSQTIDVSGIATALDTGTVKMTIDGYFGGYSNQDDNARLTATFQDSAGQPIGAVVTAGPVLAIDRNDATGLLARSQQASVPTGTRRIAVILTMTRASGATNFANDGYADNLELFLNTP